MISEINTNEKKRNIWELIKTAWGDLKYAFKDLGTQKTRTFFGISGIMISIFMMQVVGVLTDSLAFSYLDAAATNTGAADFIITTNLETSLNPYMNQNAVPQLLSDVEEIEGIHERLLLLPAVNYWDEQQNATITRTVTLYGLDVVEEHEGGMGKFLYENSDEYFVTDIPAGFCIISPFVRDTLNVSVGDTITINFATFDPYELEVMAIVEQQQKFLFLEIDTIVTNLTAIQETYALENKVNYFEVSVKNREQIYDTRKIANSIDKIRRIGEKIQDELGDEYSLNALKLQDLEQSETMNVAMSVAFIFISVISGMIAAILINSILSTAVEERIREFGVFRVLGARRSFSFKLIILQGLLLSIFGSAGGVITGTWFTQLILPILYKWLNLWSNPIPLIVKPATIISSMSIGIGITLFVTAIPAFRAATTKIVKAINPYRHQKTGWKVKKEGSVNGKLISGGLSAVAAGSLVFYLIPQIIQSGEIFVLMIAFLGVQMAFLLGLTFISLGFIPGLERVVWWFFRIFNRKTTPIVKISLKRYRRRNTSTTLMFAMTFSFILFISTTLELMKIQQSFSIKFEYGSQLAIYSTDVTNQIDEKLLRDNISRMEGITYTSAVYTDALDLRAAMLYLEEAGTANIDFSRGFGSDRNDVYLSDLIGFNEYDSNLIGIDQNYTKIVDEDLMRLKGGKATVEKLFDNATNNVIIAKSVADDAQLEINDNIRLSVYNSTTDTLIRIVNATIIGVSDGMPGFWQFRQARFTAFLGGVLCSKQHYIEWMDMNPLGLPEDELNLPLSKIFVNVNDPSKLEAMRNDIQREYDGTRKNQSDPSQGLYDFITQYAQSEIDSVLADLSTVQLLFQTILSFTILIALFGLMSSIYSTVIERKREIGVLKALGLKNRQTQNIFTMESIIILLASSVGGALIGILSAVVNSYENSAISEVPLSVLTGIETLPWGTILTSFIVALVSCLLGMMLLLRRVARMDVMEIFRETM
ncbi:MAG: ABC transporter permease [Promethearchaeota archaeon]